MRPSEIYWHTYGTEQIKPELRGHLICLLEIPNRPGEPVLRHIFDSRGLQFPTGRQAVNEMIRRGSHGIAFRGVSRDAVFDMLLADPPILKQDADLRAYNRCIISNSRHYFLEHVEYCRPVLPPVAAQLLEGYALISGLKAG